MAYDASNKGDIIHARELVTARSIPQCQNISRDIYNTGTSNTLKDISASNKEWEGQHDGFFNTNRTGVLKRGVL